MTTMTILEQATELREFFVGTYAERAIQAAIDSGNDELIRIAVNEYSSQAQQIEESATADRSY